VPDVVVPIPALTDKDRDDLQFALEQKADWIALSFVQRPEDVAEARSLIGERASLLAKIEKPAAIDRLNDIIALADAVMVARGERGARSLVPGANPLHPDAARADHRRRARQLGAADREHRLSDRHALLHELGLDRPPHRARAAASAIAGDERVDDNSAAHGSAV